MPVILELEGVIAQSVIQGDEAVVMIQARVSAVAPHSLVGGTKVLVEFQGPARIVVDRRVRPDPGPLTGPRRDAPHPAGAEYRPVGRQR